MILPRRLLGYAMAVTASLSFSFGTGLAVYTYGYGTTPLSVTTFRTVLSAIFLVLLIRVTAGSFALLPRDRWIVLALGSVMAVQSITHYIAVLLLPLAHATLLLYTYPFFIAAGAHLSGQERITPAIVTALAVAFAGLVLVLDLGGDFDFSVLGIVLAVTAAAAFSVVALVSQPIIRRSPDSRSITLHLHAVPVIAFLAASVALGDYSLPNTQEAWIMFAFVPLFYCIAVIGVFYAIGSIGSVRMSLIMNLEPVAAIVFGFVLLGQHLDGLQLLGAALVIGAVVAVRWIPAQREVRERDGAAG